MEREPRVSPAELGVGFSWVLLLVGELAWSVHVNTSQAAWISLDLTIRIGEML